jgi:hypothetical protein
MSDFDEIVDTLMIQTGIDRTRAEAIVRDNGYRRPVVDPTLIERDANALEKAEQHEVAKLFRGHGFIVYNLSQSRAAKQTPGLADLWVVHRELPIAFWFETKRQVGGEHSDAQLAFAAECQRCQVGYATGDRFAAAEHLIALGLVERTEHGILEPVRRPRAHAS